MNNLFKKCPTGEWEHTTIKDILATMPQDELRTLRAIINGKLSKRKITPEQQAKMQLSRKAKPAPPCADDNTSRTHIA